MNVLIKRYFEVMNEPSGAVAVVESKPAEGAAAIVDNTPGSAVASVDINTPDPKLVTPPAFAIPDEFKDKPYLKGVDSQEKLFKMLDGAQTLIGQKGPAVPKDDAAKEDWDKYYESIGRPKTADEYQLEGAEKGDQKFIPKVRQALHEAGLTPKQANIAWSKVNVALNEYMTEKGITDQQLDTDFEKLATDSFGVERDRVLATSKELIDKHTSVNMKAYVGKLSNENLIVLADVLNNINKTYIKQDGPPRGQPILNGQTPDQLRAKARGLMSEQGKFDPMSTEFQNLQKEIDGIYNGLRQSNIKL